MPTSKRQHFLHSTGNIVGCLLALAGLGLFFTGIIHAFWWLIVPGLYAAGVLAVPRRRMVRETAPTEVSGDLLVQKVRKLVDRVQSGLPAETIVPLRSIESTLSELLPRLKELCDRGIISPKDSFTVTETVRRYLPDTLIAYLRLPRFYAQVQALADGRTASQTLLEQLEMLDIYLKEITASAFEGDAEKLLTNGQFLQNKFGEKLAFKP